MVNVNGIPSVVELLAGLERLSDLPVSERRLARAAGHGLEVDALTQRSVDTASPPSSTERRRIPSRSVR